LELEVVVGSLLLVLLVQDLLQETRLVQVHGILPAELVRVVRIPQVEVQVQVEVQLEVQVLQQVLEVVLLKDLHQGDVLNKEVEHHGVILLVVLLLTVLGQVQHHELDF
tara:strand:- start:71 stop:397 length:327 start_codon:yes stop_codon:yes gene_type:complete